MYSHFFITVTVALAIPFINCGDIVTSWNATKGEPCSVQLSRMAEQHCSMRKQYIVSAESVTWFEAKLNCERYGYELASVTSEEDNCNIMKQLKLQGLEAPQVWIGMNDLAEENRYVWVSNVLQDVSYLNWYVGEPNNAFDNEDCVNLYPDGSFNDYNCLSNMLYVCEYYAVNC